MHGFLSQLSPLSRDRALSLACRIDLAEGEVLVERGQVDGDFFFVERGRLEVRDPASRHPIVLESIAPGEVVGELAFVDALPRSADVVAGTAAVVLRWQRNELLASLGADALFASEWWRAVALTVSRRVRTTNQQMFADRASGEREGGALASASAEVARRCRDVLAEVDERLRNGEEEEAVRSTVHRALNDFLMGFDELAGRAEDRTALTSVGRRLRRELDSYWLRAMSVQLVRSEAAAENSTTLVEAHLATGQPVGDDGLGVSIDDWLLNTSFARGVRGRDAAVRDHLSRVGEASPLRVTLLGCGTGSVAAALLMLGGGRPVHVTCVEDSPQALAFFDAGLSGMPPGVEVELVGARRSSTLSGEALAMLVPQHLIIAENWMDTVPTRMLSRFVASVRRHLAPGGVLLLGGHRPAVDALFWDHVMGHPVLRSVSNEAVQTVRAAGLSQVEAVETEGSGLLVIGAVLETEE